MAVYTCRQVLLLVYCKCLFCREWCAGYTLPHLPPMLCIHSKQPPVIQDLILITSPHHHQCWVGWVGVTVIETDSRMAVSTHRPGLARTSVSRNSTPPLYKLKSTFHNAHRLWQHLGQVRSRKVTKHILSFSSPTHPISINSSKDYLVGNWD